MPIFIPKSPRKSSCVLGRSGAAAAQPCFSAWRSGMYSSSYFWCPKIGIQWSDLLRKMIIMRFMLVYIYICVCVYIYIIIIINMDTVKYRRARGFTHLDDMGMHGFYRYTLFGRCHPSKMFNTLAKPASFGK